MLRRSLTLLPSLLLFMHASIAAAQSSPAAAPAPASLAPLPEPAHVTPAPGQAAAAAPSPHAQPITATCSLGDHPGTDPDEAYTAADILCHELARQGATNTQHEIRFGKLGGKTLITIASRDGNTYDERRTLLNGMEELPVAAPRMVTALSQGKEISETRDVDNVLSSEARSPKTQKGQMGFEGGIFGMTGLGTEPGSAGGISLGLLYRAGQWGLSGAGRAGGIGSNENKIGTASIDMGGRYYLSNGETSAFLGGGVGLSYFNVRYDDGSGFAAYGALGVEAFRTHHTAANVSLRADLPMFTVDGDYVVPLSLNLAMVFH